jgi:hypothetical protein
MKKLHKRFLAYIRKTSPANLNLRITLPFLGVIVVGAILSEAFPQVEGIVAVAGFLLLTTGAFVLGYLMRIKGVFFSPRYPQKILGITAKDVGGFYMIFSGFTLFLALLVLADRFLWPHVQRFFGVIP